MSNNHPFRDESGSDFWGGHTQAAPPAVTGTVEDVERALTIPDPAPAAPKSGLAGWWSRMFGPKAPPVSPQQQQLNDWVELIRTPTHNHRITVSCHKGGVGKTTTTLALGTVMAMYRPDQIVAIDANPDVGTLSNQLPGRKVHKRTARDLTANADQIATSQDVRQFTHVSPDRMEVLASDSDPEKARSFDAADYDLTQKVLGTYRDIVITDTGTDMTHGVFEEIINYTDTLVVAASNAVEDARLAGHTLNTWATRGVKNRGAALVPNAVVAIHRKPEGTVVTDDRLREVFEARVRRVVFIPNDPYLTRGGVFEWNALAPATQRAYIELAAAVGEGFRR